MAVLSLIIVSLFTLAAYTFLIWLLEKRTFFKKIANIPGPKGYFFIGNALDFKSPEVILSLMMKYQKKYGLSYKLQLGPDSYVFTADPKLIEIITSSNNHINKSTSYRFLLSWIGDGLLSATNPRWKIHRRLITLTFHFNILKDFTPIFHKNADNLIEHWQKFINPGLRKQIDVYEDILACALDIICETAMGISINALKDGKSSEYMDAIKYMGSNLMDRTFTFWKQFDILYKISGGSQKQNRMLKYIKNTSRDVIKQKHEEMNRRVDEKSGKGSVKSDDFGAKKRVAFLDLLMNTVDETGGTFTDEELREEVDTFIFTGHDTTASATSFVLYCLSKNPDIQEKVYQELIDVLDGDKDISYEKTSSLKYMELVIKETLRMFPIAPMYLRQLTEDVKYNNFTLPKGLNVGIFAYDSHYNEEIFDNPTKFDPERFTSENSKSRHAFAYVPFSAGPRNCIGQKFAILEMKCFLSSLIKTFKFSKAADYDIRPTSEVVLKSVNGVQLIVEPRS